MSLRHLGLWMVLFWVGCVWSTAPAAAQNPDIVAQVIGNAVRNPGDYPDVRTAVNRFRNRDFAGAKTLFEQAKEKHAELPPGATMMARLFSLANDNESTRQALETALIADPQDPEAYALLGEMLQADNYVVPAEILLKRSLELAQQYPGSDYRKRFLIMAARVGLATIAERREDWKMAVEQLQPVAQMDNRNVSAIVRLARAMFLSQPTDDKTEQVAYQLLAEVAKRVETPTPPEVQMASFCHQVKNREKAQKWFAQVTSRLPDDVPTRLAAARWALDVMDIPAARAHVDKALSVAPDSFDSLMMSGLTARFEKKWDVATRVFEQCHLLRPDEFQPINQLALALADQMDPPSQAKAMAYAQINARANPDLATRNGRDAAVTLGWLLFLSDRGTEAQNTIQQAITRGPLSPEARYFAARVMYDTGQSERAKELLESVFSQTGTFPTQQEAEQLRSRL